MKFSLKQTVAAAAIALAALPAAASVTSEGVTYSASYADLAGDLWQLTIDIDASGNTFGASFLNAISIVPGGTFSGVSLLSATGSGWGAIQNGPTSHSATCGDSATSAFCVAGSPGSSTASPIQFVFQFTDANIDTTGPHVQVSWDVTGHHFSQTVPVPEPSTYALMLGGLGLIGFMARRRRAS